MISEVNFYTVVFLGVKDMLWAIYTTRDNTEHSYRGLDIFKEKFEPKTKDADRGVKYVEEMLQWFRTNEIGMHYPREIVNFIEYRLEDYKRQIPTLPNPIFVYKGGTDQIISRLNDVIKYLQYKEEND